MFLRSLTHPVDYIMGYRSHSIHSVHSVHSIHSVFNTLHFTQSTLTVNCQSPATPSLIQHSGLKPRSGWQKQIPRVETPIRLAEAAHSAPSGATFCSTSNVISLNVLYFVFRTASFGRDANRENHTPSGLSPLFNGIWRTSHLQTGTSVPCLYVDFAIPDRGFSPMSLTAAVPCLQAHPRLPAARRPFPGRLYQRTECRRDGRFRAESRGIPAH